MKVDTTLVKHIAKLGNLTLSEAEIKLYTRQIKSILAYIETLNKVDTANIKPTYQTLDKTTNVWREDKLQPERGLTQKQALSQAKKTYQGYFVADHVFSAKSKSAAVQLVKRPQLDKYNAVLTEVNPKVNLVVKDLFCTKDVETTAGLGGVSRYKPQ